MNGVCDLGLLRPRVNLRRFCTRLFHVSFSSLWRTPSLLLLGTSAVDLSDLIAAKAKQNTPASDIVETGRGCLTRVASLPTQPPNRGGTSQRRSEDPTERTNWRTMGYPIRAGLAGIGGYGVTHARALETLEQEGKVRFVAAADPRLDANREMVSRLRQAGVRVTDDWQALLEEEIDLLLIAAPIHLHAEMAVAALRRGIHVFCEKPAAVTIQDVEAICQAERESGKKVGVGFQYLTGELLPVAAQLLAGGRLGKVKRIVAVGLWQRGARYFSRNSWAGKRRVDGRWVLDGPMNNALIHQLNNALYLAGAIDSGCSPVLGQPVTIASPAEVRAELYRASPWTEMEDTATLFLRTEEGTAVYFLASYCSPRSEPVWIVVQGERGRLTWSEKQLEIEEVGGRRETRVGQPGATSILIRNMVDVAAGLIPSPLVPVAESRKLVRATNGAYLSTEIIHPIDARFTQVVEPPPDQPQAERLVVLPGLNELFRSLASAGNLPSDTGVPWSVSTRLVSVRGLTRFEW